MGIDIDYYVEVNMAGFASIIDAVGGVTVDVGPVPLPIGGVLPDGRHVKPSGYVPAGVQHLDGNDALWFARSRRDSNDYNRMGRQRCLLQSLLQQKSPTDVITHFQGIAAATTNSVTTNIPQEVLGALVSLSGEKPPSLQSVSFDPSLPDPNESDGHFNTSHVDVAYMQAGGAGRVRRARARTGADDNRGRTHDDVSPRHHSHDDARADGHPGVAGLRHILGAAPHCGRYSNWGRPVPP